MRYPASSWAANSRTPTARLPSICCPTVRMTKDGPLHTQAGSSAEACREVSWPVRTASDAATAAGAKPPKAPMSSTPPAPFARMPMSRAAGRNTKPSHCPAPQPAASADTMRNGNSDTSSGPPHSRSPACRASAQRCGAANTRNAVYPASASSTPRRKFQLRFITQPSASIYM